MKLTIIIMMIIITSYTKAHAQIDTIPPATPANVQGFGYEKHIDIDWYENSESDIAGYKIYRRVSGVFTYYTSVTKEVSYKSLYLGTIGITNYFKVSAYDLSGNESSLSDSVECTTHEMNDDEFLDMVQRATFRFFYDYGHPVSGLARERFGSGETVTTGGSGFGVMALPIGIERGFITREQGVTRMLKIVNFLNNTADRFHGAFSHWLNGTTGDVIPFGTNDNGGDLVETSFMIQGLLACRQYFNGTDSSETLIRDLITNIWESVEYSWYRRYPTGNYLYWHWSPNYGWIMNFPLIGPNETMICYLLGIASPNYSIPSSMYHNGWASSSNYTNPNSFYGYRLWVGWDNGGPLFFAHYSFLGFDPRAKKDIYCNYFMNNRNHTLINRAYCIDNPYNRTGYGPNCWGLTASDDPFGYGVHEPYNDNGTISPTAALSSIAYTPQESIEALKYFYRTFGSSVWGEYGFKDAFNQTQNWFANSYIAIDQGPIIVMIENYRSGLLWEKFMANPEIQPMLDAIGFVPDSLTSVDDEVKTVDDFELLGNYPNPFNPTTTIVFNLPSKENVLISIYNHLGEKIRDIVNEEFSAGENKIVWDGLNDHNKNVSSGIYLYKISTTQNTLYGKMILQK